MLKTMHKIVFLLAFLFEVGGVGVTGYLVYQGDVKPESAWIAPVAVLCLSVAWLPPVNDFIIFFFNITHLYLTKF